MRDALRAHPLRAHPHPAPRIPHYRCIGSFASVSAGSLGAPLAFANSSRSTRMMVPLLMNRPAGRTPRRTTDLFASALDALGVDAPAVMDGRSFL